MAQQTNTSKRMTTLTRQTKPGAPSAPQRQSLSPAETQLDNPRASPKAEAGPTSDLYKAVQFMMKNGYYIMEEEPLTAATGAEMALRVYDRAKQASQEHVLEAIKSIGVILKEVFKEERVVADKREMMDKEVKAIREAREEMARTVKEQKEGLEAMRNDATGADRETREVLGRLVAGVGELTQRMQKMEEDMKRQPMGPAGGGVAGTYAAVVASGGFQKSHATAIARGEEAEKQIILNNKNKGEGDATVGLRTEQELIAKAEITLKLMLEEGETPPVHVKFVTGYRAKTGAVIYTLNSREAAAWLKHPERLRVFNAKFGGSVEMHAKIFNVIAYYVPTTFEPGSEVRRRQVERDNGLKPGGLIYARYIKAIQRRAPNQRRAHVILGFATRAEANEAIAKRWLIVDEMKVTVKKLVAEPRRCYKCQSVRGDHTSERCNESTSRCARCAGAHPTEQCSNPKETKCANCNSLEHGAGSCDCPAFLQSVRAHAERHPEVNYKFYPILGDPMSLEMLDGTYAPDPRQKEPEKQVDVDMGVHANEVPSSHALEIGQEQTEATVGTLGPVVNWDVEVTRVLQELGAERLPFIPASK